MIPSELQFLANHLWQSTLFAAVAGLLSLVLRRNRAEIRYSLWLAASMKFLIPFSLLVEMGSHWARRATPATTPPVLFYVIQQASQPFSVPTPLATATAVPTNALVNWVPAVLSTVWAIGFATLICSWWRRWRSISAVLRTASPVDLQGGIEAMISPAFGEPGVFGVLRPVLLLPAGITDCLTPTELKAIVAHELCHIRRRDNLTTVIHMSVEALFWFHPLVWWLGARLMEEREHACDEEVLLMGSEPQAYAEGILKICELYLESPLPCVSGVTGANLKSRIENIMQNRMRDKLSFSKKAVLLVSAITTVVVPVIGGILSEPLRAQTADWQTAAAGKMAFEVASIKPNNSHTFLIRLQPMPGGRLVGENVPLRFLIMTAYHLPLSQISGGPSFGGEADRYDIEAKAPIGSDSRQLTREMLQTLLETRFRLKYHWTTEQRPVYELTVNKGGARIKHTAEGSCVPIENVPTGPLAKPGDPVICGFRGIGYDGLNRKLEMTGTTMTELAGIFATTGLRTVIDRTGLSGTFDVSLRWAGCPAPGPGGPADPDTSAAPPECNAGPDLFSAIKEQLGLKLESAKGPVQILVIDHVERPSEN